MTKTTSHRSKASSNANSSSLVNNPNTNGTMVNSIAYSTFQKIKGYFFENGLVEIAVSITKYNIIQKDRKNLSRISGSVVHVQ